MIKTLCSLLFIVFLLSSSHAYDDLDITPQIIENLQPTKPLNTSYKPIDVFFDHSNVNVSEKDLGRQLTYLNETILSHVQHFLRLAFKVLPRNSKIIAKSDICGNVVKIPPSASETGYDSDLVVFIKIFDSNDDFDFVRGAACGLDETTGRPIVGVLTFGDVLEWASTIEVQTERRIALTIRELGHILGFQEKLFPYFINPDTMQPLTGHFFNKTVNDVNTLVLNVAPLTQKVRDYFNCPTAEGAYLENEGNNLTKNSHFERRIFGNELMTAGEIFDRRISQFTLAFFEGTGWYKVNYDLAESLTYGKNQGCAFLDTKCLDPVTLEPNFKEFCSPLVSEGLSWTGRGFGRCGIKTQKRVNKDPSLIAAFDYWGNQTAVEDKYSDNCPYYYTPYTGIVMHLPQEFDCENSAFSENTILSPYETRGLGSKAFMGSLNLTSYAPRYPYRGYCFKPKCVHKSDGNYEVQIPVGSSTVLNCTAAGFLNASDFGIKRESYGKSEDAMVGVLECPDPKEFCEKIESENFCRAGCFGKGVCSENQCKCQDGWGIGSCAAKQEAHQSERCTKDSNRTTAYGDDCICSSQNITCRCLLNLTNTWQCKDILEEYAKNLTKSEEKKDSSNENPLPTGSNNRAIYLGIGLLFVVIAVVFIKRRKQADDLNTALVEGRHDISAF